MLKPFAIGCLVAATVACATPPVTEPDAPPTASLDDFRDLIGDDWLGSLTYLNYGEPKQDFTIPAALSVRESETGLGLYFQYPDEPDQNSRSALSITEEGRVVNGDTLTERSETGETLTLVTEGACQDMGQPATCEMIYTISDTALSIRKMVQYDGAAESFRRNEFEFVR